MESQNAKLSVFSREFILDPGQSNAERELPLPRLVTQMIDLAAAHANHLGIGYDFLSTKNMGWILSRLTVEMNRWPATGEGYRLETWVENWNSHFSQRCFAIYGNDDAVIGYARSLWVVIDLEQHKNMGTAEMIMPTELQHPERCPLAPFEKRKVLEYDKSVSYRFTYSDLDYYRHVNTVKYISLLLNQFSLEDFDSNRIAKFEIAFVNEARYGQDVEIKSFTEYTEEKDNPKSRQAVNYFVIQSPEKVILRALISLARR